VTPPPPASHRDRIHLCVRATHASSFFFRATGAILCFCFFCSAMSKRKADVLADGPSAPQLWCSVAILIHVILCGWSLRSGRRHRRQCSECVCVAAAFHRSGDRTHLRMHCQSEQRHRRRLHPHTLKHIRVATQLVDCSLPVASAVHAQLLQQGEVPLLGVAGLLHCQSL
jgi:hypothetical protein